MLLAKTFNLHMCWQGVSGAGFQLGVHDSRSMLVEEPFKTYDRLSRPPGPETNFYCNTQLLNHFQAGKAWDTVGECGRAFVLPKGYSWPSGFHFQGEVYT